MKIANPRHKYFLLLIFKLILLSISIYHPSISPNGASVPSVDASNNIDDSDHTPTSMLLLLPLRLLLLPPPLLLLLLQLSSFSSLLAFESFSGSSSSSAIDLEADDVTLPAPRRPLLSSYPITDGQTLQQKLV